VLLIIGDDCTYRELPVYGGKNARTPNRDPTLPHDLDGVREFVTRDESPFLLVVGLTEPHVPWVMGDASAYPPAKLELPKNLADTEMMRECYSRYLAEITYMDGQVGDLVEMIAATNKRDDTIVIFTSEQGAQFPGFKWTNYDVGVHTGLIVRWPGKVAEGTRTDALVQYADVVPTLLDAAGAGAEQVTKAGLDGDSFLPVLLGNSKTHRDYVFGTHNNIPEGPPYPIRSIGDGRYRYIRNLIPENIYIEKHLMGVTGSDHVSRNYWKTWMWDAGTSEHTYALIQRYQNRPAEELDDSTTDPLEMKNLASDESMQAIKQRLSSRLDEWFVCQTTRGLGWTPCHLIGRRRKASTFTGDKRLAIEALYGGIWSQTRTRLRGDRASTPPASEVVRLLSRFG